MAQLSGKTLKLTAAESQALAGWFSSEAARQTFFSPDLFAQIVQTALERGTINLTAEDAEEKPHA